MEIRKTNGMGYLTSKWPLDPAKATLVFIHGAGGMGNFWQAQIEGLADAANTIAIDLPGHGQSDGSGCDTIEDYARATADFMQGLETSNLIPCGFSMGGAISQQILLDYPDLARAGILICSGATMPVGAAIFEGIQKDYNGFVDFLCKIAASKKTDPGAVGSFRDGFFKVSPEATLGDFTACNRFDVTNRLSTIAVPVLIVTAEEDKLTPAKYGEVLEKAIKNATRTHIHDAGHVVAMEKSEAVNQAILQFINQTGL